MIKNDPDADGSNCKSPLEKTSHFDTNLCHMKQGEFVLHRSSAFCLTYPEVHFAVDVKGAGSKISDCISTQHVLQS